MKKTRNSSVLGYGELVCFEASFNSVARTYMNVKRFPVKMFAVLFSCRLLIKPRKIAIPSPPTLLCDA